MVMANALSGASVGALSAPHPFELFQVDAVETTLEIFTITQGNEYRVYRNTRLWMKACGFRYTFSYELRWSKYPGSTLHPTLVGFSLNRSGTRGMEAAAVPGKIGDAMGELFSKRVENPLEAALAASFHTNFAFEAISFCATLIPTEGEASDAVWRARVESWLRGWSHLP